MNGLRTASQKMVLNTGTDCAENKSDQKDKQAGGMNVRVAPSVADGEQYQAHAAHESKEDVERKDNLFRPLDIGQQAAIVA